MQKHGTASNAVRLILAVLENEVFDFKVFQDVFRVLHHQGILPYIDGQVAVIHLISGFGEYAPMLLPQGWKPSSVIRYSMNSMAV